MATPSAPDTAELFVGLMSGTSIDSIDAVLVAFRDQQATLLNAINVDIPTTLRAEITELCTPGSNEIDRMGIADRQLGRLFADATLRLLRESQIRPEKVRAIGSHGQTIRHRPNEGNDNFTLQIGDPNTIAEITGITTVADFRRRDIAVRGEGAPLAPAFHNAMFRQTGTGRVIVNIGGIANITLLSDDHPAIGFDTGPGNGLMDAWIFRQRNLLFDENGDWAGTGNIIAELLNQLSLHPYLGKPTPKSTGREEFNIEWLLQQIGDEHYAAEDVQATLLEFTAASISHEISRLGAAIEEVYICGGGAYNNRLMARLATLLNPRRVSTTATLGIPPEWVEGAAFAWLARQTLAGLPGNLPSVTGADKPAILGAIYPA